MPKLSYLTAVLSTALVSLMAEAAFSRPLTYPVVQNSDTAPLCYMQTSDGRTLDLTEMCGFISPEVCSDPNNKPELAALIKEFCKKNEKCRLTSTCNDIPQTLNRPINTPPGEPL